MLKDFVAQLCVELDIESVPNISAEKSMTFWLTDQIGIEMKDLDPGISLHAKLCPCPSKRLEDLFLRLMRANYLGQETFQNRIGMSADEKFLTLSLGMPYEVSYRVFRDAVEDFANFVLYWREEIEKFEQQDNLL